MADFRPLIVRYERHVYGLPRGPREFSVEQVPGVDLAARSEDLSQLEYTLLVIACDSDGAPEVFEGFHCPRSEQPWPREVNKMVQAALSLQRGQG